MRILVIGKTGQLAHALAYQAPGGLDIHFAGRPRLDLTDPQSVTGHLTRLRPDVVINAAAYTDVEAAETDPMTWRINADAVGDLAQATARTGAALIHVSTDYVFDGTKDNAWTETDPTRPLNAYGASKLAGERLALAANPRTLIVRTSWLFSPWGRNFVTAVLGKARETGALSIVADQLGTPTSALDLARCLLRIARQLPNAGRQSPLWGVVHGAGQGTCSWSCLAGELFQQAAPVLISHKPQITAIRAADWPSKAPRPRNSALDTTRLADRFGETLPPWQDGLRRTLALLVEQTEDA